MSKIVDGLRSVGRKLAGSVGQAEEQQGRDNRLKTPVFIVGCQRSGTTMLQRVLDASPQMQVYGEGRTEAFGKGVRIRSDKVIRSLIHDSREPIVIFKPLNDTQCIDRLLDSQPNAKAVWMYRHFHDVVNSLVVKWGDMQVNAVHQIATGRYIGPGAEALGERVTADDRALAIKLDERGLSAADAAAFIWYLRNVIYFDLQLDSKPEVLLCKYEDTVTDPGRYLRRVFEFAGGDFSPDFVASVSSRSIHKNEAPVLGEEIAGLCKDLLARIDAKYLAQLESESVQTL